MADRLYDIDSKLLELLERGFNSECLNEDGEIDEEKAQAFLVAIQGQRNDKIENIALYIKNLRASAKSIKEEIAVFDARKKAKERKADTLERYLATSLSAFGEKKFETTRVELTLRKSKQIKIDGENERPIEKLIPKEYVRETVKYSADKTALKKALEMGEIIDGVRIEEIQNLQIK